MKTVTTHAGVVQLGRDREALRDVGIRAVKRSVEASYLRQVRQHGGSGANRGQVVRLVQRRERDEFLERRQHLCIDAHRLGVVKSAVHDTVADSDERVVCELLLQEFDEVL